MRMLLVALAAAGGLSAQTFAVTTSNDSGAGSLRQAVAAANAYGPGAEVRITAAATAAPIRLVTRLPLLDASGLTVAADAGAGRLTLDATGVSGSSGVGLEVRGSNVRLLAPMRIVVASNFAVALRTGPAEVADLELRGGGPSQGLLIDSADDVTVRRLDVSGFATGVLVLDSNRARIATSAEPPIRIDACRQGVALVRGGDHAVGSLLCTDSEVGVVATDSRGLRVGTLAGPRSQIDRCRWHGIELGNCDDARIENVALRLCGSDNGFGLNVTASDRLHVQAVEMDGCRNGAVMLAGGCQRPWLQGLRTSATLGPSSTGVFVHGADGVTLVGSTIGPGHQQGVAVGLGTTVLNEFTMAQCTVGGNAIGGVILRRVARVLLHDCTITGNLGSAVHAGGTSLADAPTDITIAECRVSDNPGFGVACQFAQRVRIGPGNVLQANRYSALFIDECVDVAVTGNPLIQGNRGTGVEVLRTPGARVDDTVLRGHPGVGLVVVDSPGTVLGPGILIEDNGGPGLRIENCEDVALVSSRIVGGATTGIHLLRSDHVSRTRPNLLQSCVIAGHAGMGIYLESGAPTICELVTIAGNLRGVYSHANPLTIDSCIVWGNLLEDLHQIATATTIRHSIHATPPPNAANGNAAVDPRFVAPSSGDWRLQAGSPAIDSGNQALNLPPDAVDAFAGPRRVGALDRGAYEFGPHPPPGGTLLTLARPTMAPGGGGLSFRCRYPTAVAGSLSLLLMQFGPPSGSFQAFGATVPLSPSALLLFPATDGRSLGTLATVPPDGVVTGALLWSGLVPPQLLGASFSVCAVAIDANPRIGAVSNPATFSVQ